MTQEEIDTKKENIIEEVEEFVESGYGTFDEIVADIQDRLCYLWP